MYKNREDLIKEIEDLRNERDAAMAYAKEAADYIVRVEEQLKEEQLKEARWEVVE